MMLDELYTKLAKALEVFKSELTAIRTGRANSGLVEDLLVESYGSQVPLKQLAGISMPDAQTIAIQPWDKSNLAEIEKAIKQASLGLNPINDGSVIRISTPPLSGERRDELVRLASQKAEAARIVIRNLRRDVLEGIDQQVKAKTMSEDEQTRLAKQVQDKINDYNRQIEQIVADKEKDITTI